MSAVNTKTSLTKRLYKNIIRAYFLQNGFNYGNYQGLDIKCTISCIKKIYKDDEKDFKKP